MKKIILFLSLIILPIIAFTQTNPEYVGPDKDWLPNFICPKSANFLKPFFYHPELSILVLLVIGLIFFITINKYLRNKFIKYLFVLIFFLILSIPIYFVSTYNSLFRGWCTPAPLDSELCIPGQIQNC